VLSILFLIVLVPVAAYFAGRWAGGDLGRFLWDRHISELVKRDPGARYVDYDPDPGDDDPDPRGDDPDPDHDDPGADHDDPEAGDDDPDAGMPEEVSHDLVRS